MTGPAAYRMIVQARNKPDSGLPYLITLLDDPLWSRTANCYPSPEAASEAGRAALESLLAGQAGR
jgi:hypothetical protein